MFSSHSFVAEPRAMAVHPAWGWDWRLRHVWRRFLMAGSTSAPSSVKGANLWLGCRSQPNQRMRIVRNPWLSSQTTRRCRSPELSVDIAIRHFGLL